MRLALGCLLLALPALAQLDSSALRAKFGVPLNRETFQMPQGFDLTVDYGAGNQVCKLTVPADGFNSRQKMQDFLADLVPASMRGKELNRFMMSTGAFSGASATEYEHVTISQSESGGNDTIQVIFKDPAYR
jgi:hypothetical protein